MRMLGPRQVGVSRRVRTAICDSLTRRSFGAMVGLMVVCSACSTGEDAAATNPSERGVDEARALQADELVAVCLTDPPEAEPDARLATDLCTVTLDGERRIVRPSIDPAEPVAIAPDRETVAFIENGQLSLIGVDGSREATTAVAGSAPEWLSASAVGLVTDDARAIVSVDVKTLEHRTVLASSQIPADLADAVIDGFAVSDSRRDIVISLFDDHSSEDGFQPGDRSGIAHLDTSTGRVEMLLGPLDEPLGSPDFGPADQLLLMRNDDIHLAHLDSARTTLVSPDAWVGTSPTWSSDGERVAWLANGVGSPEGPALLSYIDVGAITTNVRGAPFGIIGNEGGPLVRFPAFPDW